MSRSAIATFSSLAIAGVLSVGAVFAQTDSGHGGMMMKMQPGKTASEADKGYGLAMQKMNDS